MKLDFLLPSDYTRLSAYIWLTIKKWQDRAVGHIHRSAWQRLEEKQMLDAESFIKEFLLIVQKKSSLSFDERDLIYKVVDLAAEQVVVNKISKRELKKQLNKLSNGNS